MRFMTAVACAAALLPLAGSLAAADSATSEIRLRSGEVIVGRVLQEDSAWVIVDVEGGTIASIERARVREIVPLGAVATSSSTVSPDGRRSASLRGWTLGLDIAWGWTTAAVNADQTIRDHGTSSSYRLSASADTNDFDDAFTYTLRLLTDHILGQDRKTVFGAQLVVMPGDIINPEVPVWSLEAVGGLRWGEEKATLDLRGSAGFAFTSGEIQGVVFGSNGFERYATTDSAVGWQLRAELAGSYWLSPSLSIDAKLGTSYRELYADLDYRTRTYSGEISLESSATAIYLGLGLSLTL